MIQSLFVILLVCVVAYVWASRGFFSSLVHMLCVLVAGAVAFGLWEPIAYAILASEPKGWIVDLTWGAALAVPFAVVLAVLRLGIDSILKFNTDVDSVTNLVGGGLCGAVSGTISVGILILSIGFLRMPAAIMGHQPMAFDSKGSIYRESSLIFPADRITVGLYSTLSRTTLRTASPMALWRPRLAEEGHLLRTNFNEGGARHTLTPKAFTVLGRYTVGRETAVPMKELTSDSFEPNLSQAVNMLDQTPPASPYLEGFVVQFKASAREKEGRVVIGNAQVRLVCVPTNDPMGESIAVHPFAMISQAAGDKLDLGRWRFEKPKIFIASVGGAADVPMAFEFLVPSAYQPLALYVKGVRVDVRGTQPFQKFTSTGARDAAIREGTILSSVAASTNPLNTSQAIKFDALSNPPEGGQREVMTGGGLAGQVILNKDNIAGIEIDENNNIISADAKYRSADIQNRGLERRLQVREFASTPDTKVVQVRVGGDSRIGLLTDAARNADPNKPAVLVDENGQRYQAIGYVYQDATEFHVRFQPGRPLSSISELPNSGPSSSRPDQKFVLVFRVSSGVNLKYFAIGDDVVAEFDPVLQIQGF